MLTTWDREYLDGWRSLGAFVNRPMAPVTEFREHFRSEFHKDELADPSTARTPFLAGRADAALAAFGHTDTEGRNTYTLQLRCNCSRAYHVTQLPNYMDRP